MKDTLTEVIGTLVTSGSISSRPTPRVSLAEITLLQEELKATYQELGRRNKSAAV